ncbi:MAG: glycosyltransferase family 4 protein [Candidatus Korarchaeum sp.]
MRILVFSELLYPRGGGAELATWLYAKMLAERGFEICIVTSKSSLNKKFFEITGDQKIKIYEFPMKALTGTRYHTLANIGIIMSNLITKLIKWSDIIYVPGLWYSVIPFAKIHRKPVVVHLHNYFIVCPTSLMYDFMRRDIGSCSLKSFILHEYIEKRKNVVPVIVSCTTNEFFGKHYSKLAKMADKLIFVSESQTRLALSKDPSLKDKSYIVYNPIPDISLIKTEQKGISYFGGKSFVKGFYVLLRALKAIKGGDLEVYLMKTSDIPKRLRMDNGVLLNLLPKVDPRSVMRETSTVVIPSLSPEPLPYALVESMLYGKLIVASNVGGIPEIVGGSLAGVKLIEPWDFLAIADAIDYFLSLDLESINEIGIKNREHIMKMLNNERTLKLFIKVLCEALDSV